MWCKILIVADQPVVRFGLSRLLSQERDFEVCAEADGAAAALRQIQAKRPHVTLIGLPLDKRLHFNLLPQLRAAYPPMKIVVGTHAEDPSLACRFVRCGADGCVHWSEPVAKIVEAIKCVLNGNVYLGDGTSRRLLQSIADGHDAGDSEFASLSDREINIFAMIGQGLTTQQIAHSLDLSPRTIESHRKKIKIKLQVRNAANLNRRAYQWWRENN